MNLAASLAEAPAPSPFLFDVLATFPSAPSRLGRALRDTSAPGKLYKKRDGSSFDVAILPASADAAYRHAEAKRRRSLDSNARLFAGMTDAIARAHDAHELLTEACRVVADVCSLDLAWVGFTCPEGRVRTAARAGIAQGTLDAMRIEVGDGPNAMNPTARAVRRGRPVVHLDVLDEILHDNDDGGWHEAAWAQSLRSVAAFPLRLDGKVVGAWTLCSARSYAFDAPTIAMIGRTAECLARTLERMARAERAARAC
jgi:transcriptional regulator with GAF, ATPase, and Fis domain